jgi:DNA-directed RNA polymerase specialized sigma24 family protein
MAQFRDLYLEHQPLVYAAIAKGLGPVYRRDSDFCRTVESETGALMVGNETAQELAGETWTDVLKKLGNFKPGKAKITTWIYKIAYFKGRNHMRLRTRRSKKESFLTLDDLAAQEQQSLTCCE